MKYSEITGELFLEMAFPKKMIENRVSNLEYQINQYLLKIIGMKADNNLIQHWKTEVKTWYREIGNMVWKNTNKPLKAKIYFELLYDYPFGGVEERNINRSLEWFEEEYGMIRNGKPVDEIASILRTFHQSASEIISNSQSVSDLIDSI